MGNIELKSKDGIIKATVNGNAILQVGVMYPLDIFIRIRKLTNNDILFTGRTAIQPNFMVGKPNNEWIITRFKEKPPISKGLIVEAVDFNHKKDKIVSKLIIKSNALPVSDMDDEEFDDFLEKLKE